MTARADQATTDARSAGWIGGVRAAGALALGFSTASAIEYHAHDHTFCAPGSGCGAVRASQLGQTIGDALPLVGVIGFLVILSCTLSQRARVQLLGIAFAATGGLVGAALLALQGLVVGAWCGLCVGADVAALLAAACAVPLLRARLPIPVSPRARALGRVAILLPLLAPAAWTISRPTRMPAFVASLAVPNKIAVVEFSDFECPFCRSLHPVLAAELARHGERVHFVRKSFPLPSHRYARIAARAYVCAEAAGAGEAMADRLFAATDLSADACARHAAELGLDPARFQACTRDPATDAAIERDIAAIRADGFHGLPTVWIDREVIEGFDSRTGGAPYAAALARAGRDRHAARAYLPWILLALLTCAALLPSRRNKPTVAK